MSDIASVGGIRDRRWLILGVIGLAQLMVVLDLTVMNIALPSAQRALHFSTVDRQWVVTAYTLSFGRLLLLGSKLADLLGRKVTFLTGLAGFSGIFTAGAVIAGALLRRGPLVQKPTPSPAHNAVATAQAGTNQDRAR
jgi:MFS family permease